MKSNPFPIIQAVILKAKNFAKIRHQIISDESIRQIKSTAHRAKTCSNGYINEFLSIHGFSLTCHFSYQCL